jgi:GTPase SAR1 family protein
MAITTSLLGPGGFGKTTLAKALCHDDRVINAFSDGILWVTLGETPDLQRELTRLHRALTGERSNFLDVEEAAHYLAQHLADKHCFIVIDDVWNRSHLDPLLRRHLRTAITTRCIEVVANLGAPVKVNEMSEDEANRLTRTW